ncbi:MAG TPA: right-handed parallel beta-helix repeat-containing protein, partial [Thermoanaerobaculia bacterium]|nr:right-handed parallel beta-helix repeat-containing protein [Thermoanaerobaculia bacterium]
MHVRLLTPPRRWGPFRRALGLWLVVFLSLGSEWAFAATYFVNATTGNDANDGVTLPWKTITRALTGVETVSGDTVSVAPGVYDSTNGESFPLVLKDGVSVVSQSGPGSTSIIGDGSSPVIQNINTPLSSATSLSGFTLSNGTANLVDFRLDAASMAPQIIGNVFTGSGSNTAIFIDDGSGAAGQFTGLIEQNQFTNFLAGIDIEQYSGGADFIAPTIRQNTFTGNATGVAMSVSYAAGGTQAPLIENNTFTNSTAHDLLMSVYASLNFVAFTPTIQNNTSTNVAGAPFLSGSVELYTGSYDVSPVITSNTVQGPMRLGAGMSANAGTMNFSPMVSGNTITMGSFGSAISVTLSQLDIFNTAHLIAAPTVTGNIINGGYFGVVMNADIFSMTGNAQLDFTPLITNNTIDGVTLDGIEFAFSGSDVSGNVFVNSSPTISGNTLSNIGGAGIQAFSSMDLFFLSTATGTPDITTSPTISNNTVTQSGSGIYLSLYLYGNSFAALTTTPVITGNQVIPIAPATVGTTSGDGLNIFRAITDWQSVNADFTIDNNTVDRAAGEGIDVNGYYFYGNQSGSIRKSISGNTATNNTFDGINVSFSVMSGTLAGQTILINGNTMSGNGGNGLSLDISGQTSLTTNDIQITGNEIFSNAGSGMVIRSEDWQPGGVPTNAVLVSCNTVTGNTGDGIVQPYMFDPPADLGGGNRASPGGNRIYGNGGGTGFFDVRNDSALTLMAE